MATMIEYDLCEHGAGKGPNTVDIVFRFYMITMAMAVEDELKEALKTEPRSVLFDAPPLSKWASALVYV